MVPPPRVFDLQPATVPRVFTGDRRWEAAQSKCGWRCSALRVPDSSSAVSSPENAANPVRGC